MAVPAPTAVARALRAVSMAIQVASAAIGARMVLTVACTAVPLTASALPPLKPTQPNQSSAAPVSIIGTLCGRNAWRP